MPTYKDFELLNSGLDSLTATLLKKDVLRQQAAEREAAQRTADERTGIARQEAESTGRYHDAMAKAAQERSGPQFKGYAEEYGPNGDVLSSGQIEGPPDRVIDWVTQARTQKRDVRLLNAPTTNREGLGTATVDLGDGVRLNNVKVMTPEHLQELVEAQRKIKAAGVPGGPQIDVKAATVTTESGKKLEVLGIPGSKEWRFAPDQETKPQEFTRKRAEAALLEQDKAVRAAESELADAVQYPAGKNQAEIAANEKRLRDKLMRAQMQQAKLEQSLGGTSQPASDTNGKPAPGGNAKPQAVPKEIPDSVKQALNPEADRKAYADAAMAAANRAIANGADPAKVKARLAEMLQRVGYSLKE